MDGAAARPMPPADDAARVGKSAFCYEEAFSRNLGWLTEWEQQSLRYKRVAIAGMGGVGGSHLMALTRLGIGAFTIADPDRFELVNFNRQIGATLDTIGRLKVDVLAENARKVNPELDIARFDRGVDERNIDEFLAGVDVYIDALDFFVLDIRHKLTDRCGELGIPVVNAAPIGMGTAFLVFEPGGMSFEQWFRLEGLTEEQQYVSYLLGMAPSGMHRSYLADPSRVDLRGRRGPSTAAACELCAGVAAVETVKLLIGRGRVKAVPYYHHFDAYRGRLVVRKMRGGNANPIQRLKIAVTRRLAAKLSRQSAALPAAVAPAPASEIEKILDIARWAPSGDNTQPWRFEVIDDERAIVHIQCTGDVYDYNDGEPTLLSAGFLLESLRIAASGRGRSFRWSYHRRLENTHGIGVEFLRQPGLPPDRLMPFLSMRSVDRRAYRLTPLTPEQKSNLTETLGDGLTIEWHESPIERWRAALLNARATDIRLRIPEAFDVHRRVMDWQQNFSQRGIPGTAIGLDPMTLQLTRWLMRDWRRVELANRLAGTALARLEMDLLPGLFCAAHFTMRMPFHGDPGDRVASLLSAGQSVQRFWLTATRLGLVLQPTLAPLCFAHYGRERIPFTGDEKIQQKASTLAAQLGRKNQGADRAVFLGRIGSPTARRKVSRSVRRAWQELVVQS